MNERTVPTLEEVAASLAAASMRSYSEHSERSALRCALGDAAALCDRIAGALIEEHRGRNGTGATTKHGRELAAAAKRCGDAIWAMREKITHPDKPAPAPQAQPPRIEADPQP